MQAVEYSQFIDSKRLVDIDSGFDIDESFLNPKLFPFQKAIVRWALNKGRAAIEAVFRKQTITVTVDVEAIARKLRRTLDQDQISQLIQLLEDTDRSPKPDHRNLDKIISDFQPAWDALAKR